MNEETNIHQLPDGRLAFPLPHYEPWMQINTILFLLSNPGSTRTQVNRHLGVSKTVTLDTLIKDGNAERDQLGRYRLTDICRQWALAHGAEE